MIGSGDSAICLDGLRLALWPVQAVTTFTPDGPRLPKDSAHVTYWAEQAHKNARCYAQNIKDTAATDAGMRYPALRERLITMDSVIKDQQGFSEFFKPTILGIYAGGYAPYLPNVVTAIALGWEDPSEPDKLIMKIEQLTTVGRYLISHPHLPWVKGIDSIWIDFFWGYPRRSTIQCPPISPAAYLGAAAILLISAETMTSPALPREGASRFDVFSGVYPYIARRWNTSPKPELPQLPIPGKFHRILRDWADNKISLTK